MLLNKTKRIAFIFSFVTFVVLSKHLKICFRFSIIINFFIFGFSDSNFSFQPSLDLKIMGQSIYIISVLKKPIKKLFLIEKGFLCPSFLISYTFSPAFSLLPSLHFFLPFPLLPSTPPSLCSFFPVSRPVQGHTLLPLLFGLAGQLVGSQFSNQGWDLGHSTGNPES